MINNALLILRTASFSYPDWLPAAVIAVLIMAVAFVVFVINRKERPDGKPASADKIAMTILLLLSTIGVFAMLRIWL